MNEMMKASEQRWRKDTSRYDRIHTFHGSRVLRGIILYVSWSKAKNAVGRAGPFAFGLLMLAIQVYVFFRPPPVSAGAAANRPDTVCAVCGECRVLDRQRSHATA